jgi:hypothetical protein
LGLTAAWTSGPVVAALPPLQASRKATARAGMTKRTLRFLFKINSSKGNNSNKVCAHPATL